MEIIRSDRKSIGIQVRRDGSLVVRAPRFASEAEILRVVAQHRKWIENQQAKMEAAAPVQTLAPEALAQLTEQAARTLPPLVEAWAQRIGVRYGRITIRRQRSRWGSCSKAGNLSFNCLLMLCPQEVVEYVVVHELCHRKQMNHSPAFWAEVARILPQWRAQERWLKTHGTEIMRRMTG